MRWGARSAALFVIASLMLSFTVATAPIASATPTTRLETVPIDTGDYCSHYELRYTGGPEANNFTIGGVDGVEAPAFTIGPICWKMAGAVAVVDSNVTIRAGQGCSALQSVGECIGTTFDSAVISTGDGHDSIRVGPSQIWVTTILAGGGDDAIRTLNGNHDVISCGDGNDVVIADSTDDVGSDCEAVQFQA